MAAASGAPGTSAAAPGLDGPGAAPVRTFPTRVFSGVQPTGSLHLGNYLGAIRRFAALQDAPLQDAPTQDAPLQDAPLQAAPTQDQPLEDAPTAGPGRDCLYCVVDLHAVTQPYDPAALAAATREVAGAYLAAGIDPARSVVFAQSAVPAHAELAWLFNCVARLGWLDRMTQFKDKAGKNRERASVGLYGYPVLMAADILVYQGTHVPVGEDQKQHLELARDIAAKFNHDLAGRLDAMGERGGLFPLPEPLIEGPATRVMSLRDGTKKMSKSDPSDLSRINLTDDAATIARKIQKAKTDFDALPSEEAGLVGRPEADNLVGLYAGLAGVERARVLREHGGKPFSAFKPALADLATATLAPVSAEMRRLRDDPGHVDAVLRDGAVRARALATPVIAAAKAAMGFASP